MKPEDLHIDDIINEVKRRIKKGVIVFKNYRNEMANKIIEEECDNVEDISDALLLDIWMHMIERKKIDEKINDKGLKTEKDAGEKMKNNTDVKKYFREKGYDVTQTENLCSHPTYIIEKDGEKKTVVEMNIYRFNESLPEEIYTHLMKGGWIAVPALYSAEYTDMEVYNKDDIEEVFNTYYICWDRR